MSLNTQDTKITAPVGWDEVNSENLQLDHLAEINLKEIDDLIASEKSSFISNWKKYKGENATFQSGSAVSISVSGLSDMKRQAARELSDIIAADKKKNTAWWQVSCDKMYSKTAVENNSFTEMLNTPGRETPPPNVLYMEKPEKVRLSHPIGLQEYVGLIAAPDQWLTTIAALWLLPLGLLVLAALCLLIF